MEQFSKFVKQIFPNLVTELYVMAPSVTQKAKDLEVQLATDAQRSPKPNPENLVFGQQFSDRMLSITWNSERGWDRPLIAPLTDLKLHPAAKVFHYAVEVSMFYCILIVCNILISRANQILS